ncbi:hypothetical protein GCM10016234_04860 [Tianweitania populi]|uniref:Uncharacterized protein n=1 Tax=Tianweitania populi TaxID=1607949 RepID=A0A8J3DST1_9HYPH|nr:hypothetical protein GCM10016234_04860 [Tianweitania populi]
MIQAIARSPMRGDEVVPIHVCDKPGRPGRSYLGDLAARDKVAERAGFRERRNPAISAQFSTIGSWIQAHEHCP